jgi:endothelin-converting enzyme/putative endopeptidase
MRSFVRWGVFAFALVASAQHAERASTHGIVLANMDRAVKPGDNFYLYANGGWLKRAVIPPDRTGIGVFDALLELSNKRTLAIIEEGVKAHGPTGSNTQKIADLYRSYMNQAGIESRGLAPIAPYLKAIAAITNKTELAHALGESLRADVDPLNNTNFHTPNLFGLWVAPGFSDSVRYAPYLLQGGLELPDRDYYLSDTESMRTIRTKYQAHIVTMLKLAGCLMRKRAARGFSRSSSPWRKSTKAWRITRRSRRPTIPGSGAISRERRRGSTGLSTFAARALARHRRSSYGNQRHLLAKRRW